MIVIIGRVVAAAAVAAAASAGSIAMAPTSSAQTAAPATCGVTWGQGAKQVHAADATEATTVVRSGRHTCYDRVVIDVPGAVDHATAAYSGARGIVVSAAAPLGKAGSALNVSLPGISSVSFTGTTATVATPAHRAYRVFTLAGPGSHTRVVVDVARS